MSKRKAKNSIINTEDNNKRNKYSGNIGGKMRTKRPDTWQFVVGNIGTLPNERNGMGLWKVDIWRRLVMDCDINLLSEINKDMGVVPEHETLEHLTRTWWKGTMCRSAYLQEDERIFRDKRQQGGVAMIANGKITSYICNQGRDERNLGR